MLGAVANVNGELRDALVGSAAARASASSTRALIELDGTERQVAPRRQRDPRRLAGRRAGPRRRRRRCRSTAALNANAHVLPVPLVNLINGGKHASNDLDFQEFIVIPVGADSILEALQISTEVNLALAEILLERYGKSALNTGDEGGYAPAISSPQEALGLLHEAVANAGHEGRFRYGLDCAATHYYDARRGHLRGRRRDAATRDGDDRALPGADPRLRRGHDRGPARRGGLRGLRRADAEASGIQIVGDDLFVTNPERLRTGLERGAANSLLWKVNQIGTLSEALDAADLAHRGGYTVVVSERSGETEDPIIADLAVALDAGQIKTGAPVRGERTAKYNRLIRIEEELGATAVLPRRRLRGRRWRRRRSRTAARALGRRSRHGRACAPSPCGVAARRPRACDVGRATERGGRAARRRRSRSASRELRARARRAG